MSSGWIKSYRSDLDSGLLRNHNRWAVLSYCRLKASHKPHVQHVGQQEVRLSPGQFIFGRLQAAQELNMNESTLYKNIKGLESDGKLNIKSNNKFSVITVVNWTEEQRGDDDEEQQKEQESNNKGAKKEHKQECNKNDKKGEGPPPVPYYDILDAYHKILVPPFPQVLKLTPKRKKYLRTCWEQHKTIQCLEWWEQFFDRISKSKLMYDIKREDGSYWGADFDWIIKEDNFVRIAEGRLDE